MFLAPLFFGIIFRELCFHFPHLSSASLPPPPSPPTKLPLSCVFLMHVISYTYLSDIRFNVRLSILLLTCFFMSYILLTYISTPQSFSVPYGQWASAYRFIFPPSLLSFPFRPPALSPPTPRPPNHTAHLTHTGNGPSPTRWPHWSHRPS